jgi:hypothetical protein
LPALLGRYGNAQDHGRLTLAANIGAASIATVKIGSAIAAALTTCLLSLALATPAAAAEATSMHV